MLRLKEKQASIDKDAPPVNDDIMKLTTSETRRNIGSVTCFLDPKLFDENLRTGNFGTDEIWLPIKDITVTPSASANMSVSSNCKSYILLSLPYTHIYLNDMRPGIYILPNVETWVLLHPATLVIKFVSMNKLLIINRFQNNFIIVDVCAGVYMVMSCVNLPLYRLNRW